MRATRLASDSDREVATAHLRNVLVRDAFEFEFVESNRGDAVDHGNGRGHHTSVIEDRFEIVRGLKVLGPRQSVGDDGRLERDHRAAFSHSRSDLVGDLH